MSENAHTDEELELRARKREADREHELAVHRAKEAKNILEHEIVVEAFVNLEEFYLQAMRNAPVTDPVKMDLVMRVYRFRLEAMDAFRGELQRIIETGMFSEHQRSQGVDRTRGDGHGGAQSP